MICAPPHAPAALWYTPEEPLPCPWASCLTITTSPHVYHLVPLAPHSLIHYLSIILGYWLLALTPCLFTHCLLAISLSLSPSSFSRTHTHTHVHTLTHTDMTTPICLQMHHSVWCQGGGDLVHFVSWSRCRLPVSLYHSAVGKKTSNCGINCFG